MAFEFSPLLGIAGAACLGGIIGLQRQAASKPAGFRTHLLVAAASAGFTAMGAHLNDTRIPSYIVVGIGFLGAGAIARDGKTTTGLTTAAAIWMAAAIGLLMGYANSFGLAAALLLTALTLAALLLSDEALMNLFHINRRTSMRIIATGSPSAVLPHLTGILKQNGIRAEPADLVTITCEAGSEIAEFSLSMEVSRARDFNDVLSQLARLPDVRRIETSEPFRMS